MEVILPILVQLIGGGVGGNALGAFVKKLSLGTAGNTIAGAVGGWLGTLLASMIPGLDGLVKGATAAAGTAGGLDIGALAGQGVISLIGGGLLTAIAGMIKNATVKSA